MKFFAAGLTLLLAFLVSGDAGAESCTSDFWGKCGDSGRYHSRYRPCASDYWGHCNHFRRRYHHHHHGHRHRHRHGHHHHGHHHHHHGEVDRGIICQPRRRVVGDERNSKDKATQTAESAWRGAVRYDYGERYQNLDHAKDIRVNCDPSTVPSRGISKLLKNVQFRCVIEATPCRAPPGAEDKGVERRIEADSDD